MSQPPQFNPPPATPYQSPAFAYGPTRPTSVTVLAIIVIVFASLGVLCSPFALIPYFAPGTGPKDPVNVFLHHNTLMRLWGIGSTVVGFVLSAINLAAAIGSLRLRPWARRAMVTVAVVQLLLVLANLGVMIFFMMPPLMEMVRGSDPAARSAAIAGLVGGFVGAIFGAILPALVLYFFQTPTVIDAFEGRSIAPMI